MADDDMYTDDFDEVEEAVPEALDSTATYQAPVHELSSVQESARSKGGLVVSSLSTKGPPQEQVGKLIAKDGDMGYDSDEGFSTVNLKKRGSSPTRGKSIQPDDYRAATPPKKEDAEEKATKPIVIRNPTPPRTPTPEEEVVGYRTPTPPTPVNEPLARSRTPSSTRSTPRMMSDSHRGATPPPENNDDAYSDDLEEVPLTPKVVEPPPKDGLKAATPPGDNDDAYSDDLEEIPVTPKKVEPPPKVDHQKVIPLGRDSHGASKEEKVNILRKKNNDLQETIKALRAQMAELPISSPAGKKSYRMTADRIHTEHAMMKKENEALTSKVKQFNRLDTLERRLAATEVEIEELEAQQKQWETVIRGNTRRLMDIDSFPEKRTKHVQEMRSEKLLVVHDKKRTEKEGQLAGNHMEFVAQRLGKAQDDTTELDQDSLKAVQELIAVLEEREKDVESLQYRIEVLRKAKESSARVTVQATQCAESEEISQLRIAVTQMRRKIERIEAQLEAKKGPATPGLEGDDPETPL